VFESPLHYDSGESPGLHADFNYLPGVGNLHTLLSVVVTCDEGSPYQRLDIRHTDGVNWQSLLIPVGATLTQLTLNLQGFTVLEDIGSITAEP